MIRKLTQRLCHEYVPPGLPDDKGFKIWHHDGSGLYVHVQKIRSKKPGAVRRRYWMLRYTTRNPVDGDVARPNTTHDYVIGPLGRYPSLQWAIDEARKLNAAFNRARKWDLISEGVTWTNPVSGSAVYSTKKRRDVVMTRQQYHDAVSAAEDLLDEVDVTRRYGASHLRQTLAFLVTAETGRRPGEIYGLERRHVNYEEGTAYLPRTKATQHDDVKIQGQTFGLSARAMDFLRQAEALAGESPFVFPAETQSGHIDKAWWAWGRIRQKAGIPEDVVMYTARHRFVSEVARQGGDVKAASVQLGHSDLSMTQNYMVTDGSELADFAESVSVGLARDRKASTQKGTAQERKKAA